MSPFNQKNIQSLLPSSLNHLVCVKLIYISKPEQMKPKLNKQSSKQNLFNRNCENLTWPGQIFPRMR